METKKHILEKIIENLGNKFSEEKVHTAMLLSFAQSLYGVTRKDCVPSPLYRVSYDEENNNISMEERFGYSQVPKRESLDINLLDILFMSNLRDIPILLEGETGTGKTFAFRRYLSTILDENEYFSHRLSVNAFLNNIFQHFQEGKMVNGMPVVEARKDRIETTAAGIVDEINRGDPTETLQLFDNEMHLSGLIHKLGTPIPKIKDKKYLERSGKTKNMLLFSAQNPASTEDAKFTGTMQLDAAIDNRLLKVYIGNAASSAGSSLWLGNGEKRRHEVFLEDFAKRTANYLRIKPNVLSDINQDWLSTYAWITNPSRTDKPILYSALELADLMTAIFSGNPIDYFKYEKNVLNDWGSELEKKVEINTKLQETERIKKINEIVNSFKVPIIFRDIVQIKKNADVLATLKNIKDALKDKDPIKKYLGTKRYVTVREVAEATALVARNKQKSGSPSPVNVINEVLNQYCTLCEEYMKDAKKFGSSFNLFDRQAGIKKVAIFKSIRENIINKEGVKGLTNKLAKEAEKLTSKISISEEMRNIIIARSCSDLLTLCGFLQQYKRELDPVIRKYKKLSEANKVVEVIGNFYFHKQKESAIIMPDIYQHRIQRTLGIESS